MRVNMPFMAMVVAMPVAGVVTVLAHHAMIMPTAAARAVK